MSFLHYPLILCTRMSIVCVCYASKLCHFYCHWNKKESSVTPTFEVFTTIHNCIWVTKLCVFKKTSMDGSWGLFLKGYPPSTLWVGPLIFLAATKQLYEWFSPSVLASCCEFVHTAVFPLTHNRCEVVISWWSPLLPKISIYAKKCESILEKSGIFIHLLSKYCINLSCKKNLSISWVQIAARG